jgi:hypothetical protein
MNMSDDITMDTSVADDNVQTANTDAEAETKVEAKSETKASTGVELRDGKMFVDGVRVYTRDDTNRIAANAKKDAESRILSDLEVESFDKVKSVVSQLRDAPEGESLNVQSLKDAVKKREQTVEELRAELQSVKTDYALKSHIGTLKDSMPTAWNSDQKSAVVDLMKARNMLHLEGDTFAIKSGEDYLTVDGETPDYASAVKVVGQTLGLPFAKKGNSVIDVDKTPASESSSKAIDMSKVNSDSAYRAAYVSLRQQNATLPRDQITNKMVLDQIKRTGRG